MLTQLPMLYGRARKVGMRDHFYSHEEKAITLKEITYIHLVFLLWRGSQKGHILNMEIFYTYFKGLG